MKHDSELLRRIEALERAGRTPTQDGGLHWFESLSIGSTRLLPVASAVNRICAWPIHITEPVRLRTLSVFAGDTVSGPILATALYRVQSVRGVLGRARTPSPGYLELSFVTRIGHSSDVGASDGETLHHELSGDTVVDPETFPWLAVMFGSLTTTMAIGGAPQGASPLYPAGPNVGFDCLTASAFENWPQTMSIARSLQIGPLYFVMRSALGSRMFGDGV